MKRLLLSAALVVAATAAHAQFTEGTKYVGISTTGLTMSYNKGSNFKMGLNADAGYFFADGWMAKANFNYNHAKNLDGLAIGVGSRYSFLQNGVNLGIGLEYTFDNFDHTTTYTNVVVNNVWMPALDNNGQATFDADGNPILTLVEGTPVTTTISKKSHERIHNIRIPLEVGYTFYLNHYLAIESAVYGKMSLNHFSEGSEFGLKIGFGFYFDDLKHIFQ